jgi:hypothetical protein
MNGQGRSLLNEQIRGRAAHTKACAGRKFFVRLAIVYLLYDKLL